METLFVVGTGFGLGSGNVEKKRVQVCLCFQTLPDFGQQPGFSLVLFPNPRFLSFIDFYFVLFYFVCFPQTSHLSSAERPESAENPTGKTFPGWKLPPGRNGTLGFEGKRANPRNFTKSLEAELPEAFATHEALVHEGAARGLGRDLRAQERGDQRIYPTFPWI